MKRPTSSFRDDQKSTHALEIYLPARSDGLLIDHQPRGGLMIQVMNKRFGREEWNYIIIPKRYMDLVKKVITSPPTGDGPHLRGAIRISDP